MAVDRNPAFSTADYWDSRYRQDQPPPEDNADLNPPPPTHEWLCSFEALESLLQKTLFSVPGLAPADDPLVLHLGSGDSVMPLELTARGYARQVCIDFSPVVVELMSHRHSTAAVAAAAAGTSASSASSPTISWHHGDVRAMHSVLPDPGSVAVAFDKSTLDSMVNGNPWQAPAPVLADVARYFAEVYRVLSPAGVFICVSFRQPHFLRLLLQHADAAHPELARPWDLQMHTLDGKGGFDYFAMLLRKKREEETL